MRPDHRSASTPPRNLTRSLKMLFSARSRRPRRKLVSLLLVLNLLLFFPGPSLALPNLEILASQILNTAIGSLSYEALFLRSLFRLAHTPAQREMPADRAWRVSVITVSPHRFVGYTGETVTYVAMGTDIRGEIVHGAQFTWESTDPDKLVIDEAGRATLLRAGLVQVTARAGSAQQTVPLLIRSTRRPLQTDAEWRADQESLTASTAGENGVGDVLASLVDKLAPTAHAQFNPWGDNPKAAGQIGTPPFIALEETRLGPVMPGTNFELPLPVVSLGGRGLATSLMLYYNSNVWGAYVSGNDTVYAFDPDSELAQSRVLARLRESHLLRLLLLRRRRVWLQIYAH